MHKINRTDEKKKILIFFLTVSEGSAHGDLSPCSGWHVIVIEQCVRTSLPCGEQEAESNGKTQDKATSPVTYSFQLDLTS